MIGRARIANAHLLFTRAAKQLHLFGGESANLYISAPHVRCQPHADPYDVVVVQWSGMKLWSLPGIGTQETHPGDVLIIPEGQEHWTDTSEQPSIHLTVRLPRITRHPPPIPSVTESARSTGPNA